MGNDNSSPGGEGNGDDIGYSIEIDTKYDPDKEFREPAAQADGPSGTVVIKADQGDAYIGIKGSVGQAEYHDGLLGAGVQGLSGEVEYRFGEGGIQAEGGYNVVSGMVQTGPVKVGADIGVRGALRAGYGGVGAIIPGFGGAIIAKDGLEVDLGPFSFKIGW